MCDYDGEGTRGFKVRRRNGDVFRVRVDETDLGRVLAAGPWFVRRDRHTFYVSRNVYRRGRHTTQQLHSFILGAKRVDHINHDGLDNRRCNLRAATNAENLQNLRGAYRTSLTGIRGVSRNGSGWEARVRLKGRLSYFGTYATPEEAGRAAARARARLMPFSPEARLAFLTPDEAQKELVPK